MEEHFMVSIRYDGIHTWYVWRIAGKDVEDQYIEFDKFREEYRKNGWKADQSPLDPLSYLFLREKD